MVKYQNNNSQYLIFVYQDKNTDQIIKKNTNAKKIRKKKAAATDENEEIHSDPVSKKRMTSYMTPNIPDDDHFLYCEEKKKLSIMGKYPSMVR